MIKNILRSAFALLKLLITSSLRIDGVVWCGGEGWMNTVTSGRMNIPGSFSPGLAAYAFLPVHSAAAAANLAAPFPLSLLHPSLQHSVHHLLLSTFN